MVKLFSKNFIVRAKKSLRKADASSSIISFMYLSLYKKNLIFFIIVLTKKNYDAKMFAISHKILFLKISPIRFLKKNTPKYKDKMIKMLLVVLSFLVLNSATPIKQFNPSKLEESIKNNEFTLVYFYSSTYECVIMKMSILSKI